MRACSGPLRRICYTWPVYEGHEWEKDEIFEGNPEWPVLEEEEAEGLPPLAPLREPWQEDYPDVEDYYPPSEEHGPGILEDEEKMEDLQGGEQNPPEGEQQGDVPLEEEVREEERLDEPTEQELKKKYKPSKVVTMMLCVPLISKSAQEVLAGTQELFTRLRHGYPVGRVHTDQGREFCNGSFRRWCLERGLARTTSCPDERAQNERAEAAINSIKQRVRRLLHGAGMDVAWWPVAARHVVELERRRRERITERLPQFGQPVVVKKRSWELQREGAFESTGEQA